MSSDKVLDKIRKLLRLAEGAGSEGEAAAAAGAAARLMAEHEVAMADLDAGEVADPEDSELVGEESVDTTGKIVPWRGSLAHSAARLFGCRMFYGCHLRGMGVPYRVVGRPRDIGAVRYTYQYLVREVERLATMAWECQELEFKLAAMRGETVYGRETAATWKTSFRLGAATTIAEHFRDKEKRDVLFFVDNAYRFAQAGNELSMLTNSIPSEDGYQATLESEMAGFHERLVSTADAFVTAVEAIYVPNDDLLDQGVQSIFPYLDSTITLSRSIYQQGILPAVDILASAYSSALSPEIVGQQHYNVALRARSLLKKAVALEKIVSLVGEAELSVDDRTTYKRAKKLQNFMTQNFFVAQNQTGRPGQFVPIKNTVADVDDIMSGKYDEMAEDKFLYIGSATELTKAS